MLADLLAEAAHDEQRVVDGDAEADHADDVRRVDRHRHETRQQKRARHRARHREPTDHERKRRGDDPAEDEQQQQRHHGQDDELHAAEVLAGHLGEVVVQRDVADRDDLERGRAHQLAQGRIEIGREPRELERRETRRLAVQLDDDQRAAAVARDERGGRRRRPAGRVVDGEHAGNAWVAPQRRQRLLHLDSKGRIARSERRAAQDQAERGWLAGQIALDQPPGASRLRLGRDVRWVEPAAGDDHADGNEQRQRGGDEDGPAGAVDPPAPARELGAVHRAAASRTTGATSSATRRKCARSSVGTPSMSRLMPASTCSRSRAATSGAGPKIACWSTSTPVP